MRHERLARGLACCLLMLGLAACKLPGSVDAQSFIILVDARGSDARPVEGVTILSPAGAEIGRTDTDGRILFSATGREGDSVEFVAQAPPGTLIADGERRRVLLKRLQSITGGASAMNVVSHTVSLRKRKLPYVLMVATNQFAGLPVVVFGKERVKLNSRGVGMFLHEGMPGDEIAVTLLTESNPLIAPVSPQRTIVLPDSPSPLLWRVNLEMRKAAEVKKPVTRSKPVIRRLPKPI